METEQASLAWHLDIEKLEKRQTMTATKSTEIVSLMNNHGTPLIVTTIVIVVIVVEILLSAVVPLLLTIILSTIVGIVRHSDIDLKMKSV